MNRLAAAGLVAGLCLFTAAPGDADMKGLPAAFDSFNVVFLLRGPKYGTLGEDELNAQQKAHLVNLEKMRAAGTSLAQGPFEAPPEAELRGLIFFPGETPMAEVERLMAADPHVRTGYMRVEVRRWLTGKGWIAWPERPK